ncbi:MAG: hemolysin III family protein [Paracoccaceae bacterium]
MNMLEPRTAYSRAEYLSDAVIHVSGVVIALVAVPVLITLTAFLHGNFAALLGISVYGVSLVAMVLFSALYNIIGSGRWAWLLRRLDHSAIFAKIAGTYTPFVLLPGSHAPWFLGGLWAAALAGIGLKTLSPERFRWLALALYMTMGWAGLLAGGAVLAHMSGPVVALILAGGLLYTVGVLFYLFDRLPFHYTVWHAFVLAASMVFFAAVTLQVVQTA